MRPEENRPLAPLTTLAIGGPARWFLSAGSEQEVAEAAQWARERGVELFVLGGGSNLLVSDRGFDGMVLHIGLGGVAVERGGGTALYRAGAGESWELLVERSVAEGCQGLECLAGIPGTVGGTPVQNVGAYGQEVSSTIERVRAFDLEAGSFRELAAAECGFGYRRSRFNGHDRGRYVVTRVDYRLVEGGRPALAYGELARAVPAGASLRAVAARVREIRRAKGMLLAGGDPDCRSAGSFFKNPVVGEAVLERIRARELEGPPCFPDPGCGPGTGGWKVPAAWLIERAGLSRGYRRGRAAISSRHSLALVNLGGASAVEILALAGEIRRAVEDRYGIRLEMEPVPVGFSSAELAQGG